MARRPKKIALEALRRVSGETVELFDRLANISDRATDRSSEVLVGVAGGAASLLIAYGVSVAIPVVSFALSGPIGACLGLPLGILAWRGRRRFRIEREATETRLRIEAEIAANKLKADEIMKRLKALPKNAPRQLRDALYREYLALAAALRSHPLPLPDQQAPPNALPPPAQQPLALLPPPRPTRDKVTIHGTEPEKEKRPQRRRTHKIDDER